MGTPDFAVPTLQSLAEGGAQIVGVYTQPDRPSGRGKKTTKSPVKLLAERLVLPVYQPETLSADDARSELEALRPDAIIVAAYGLILPNWSLTLPAHGALNVHPSLLPRHRGPAPVANAILEGDEETGVTVMLVEPDVDSGPILRTVKMLIDPSETTGRLTDRLAKIGGHLLVETLRDWICGLINPRPQDHSLATFSRKATKADGKVDWSLSAAEIVRRIRAYHPWPGSFTTWLGLRLKIIEAAPAGDETGKPGLVSRGPGGTFVQTGGGHLALKIIQPEGRRPMDITAFVAGHPDVIGAELGT